MQKKVAVTNSPVGGVDVETAFRFRGNDEKISDLILLAKVFDQIPSPRLEQSLLILAQAVQVIQNGIALCRMTDCRIIAGRQQHTIMNGLPEDMTVQSITVDPALPIGGRADQRNQAR